MMIEGRWNYRYRLILLFLFSHGITRSFTSITATSASKSVPESVKDETVAVDEIVGKEEAVVVPISTLSVPLFATHLSHHAYVYIGSPPQRRVVIVDTGSRILSFPCKPCRQCGNRHVSDAFWDPGVSTTDVDNDCDRERCVFRDVFQACQQERCVLKQSFTEGSSLTAYEINDLTWLGTENLSQSVGLHMHTAVPFTFGCLTVETGLIKAQYADGILGLSMHHDNLITVMYKERSIGANAFSLCMNRVVGGFLSIGGVLHYSKDKATDGHANAHANADTNGVRYHHHHHMEPMQFEPLTDSSTSKNVKYYTIRIISVRINNSTLPLSRVSEIFSSGKGTVIDSGTTDMYLPSGINEAFQEVWTREVQAGKHHNRVELYTYERFQKLPNVALTLSGGYDWVIRPSAYMEVVRSLSSSSLSSASSKDTADELVNGWTGEKKLANRIYLDEPTGCVLGANAMFGHDILFDIEHKRIGIARADCTYRGGQV